MAPRINGKMSRPLPLLHLRDTLVRSRKSVEAPEWMQYLPAKLRPASLPLSPPAEDLVAEQPAVTDAADVVAAEQIAYTGSVAALAPAGAGDEESGVQGRVWELSQDRFGCRRVQAALDEASSDAEREKLVDELRGHVLQAAKCPHANFVLQKAISTLRPRAVCFIVDEVLSASPSAIALHKFGCRIIQRLIQHLYPAQVHDLVEELLKTPAAFISHPYGNYVAQVILEHGSPDERRKIFDVLEKNLRGIAAERYGCAVLGAALVHAEAADRERLARTIAKQPGLLLFVASGRNGAATAISVLATLQGHERSAAADALLKDMGALRGTTSGQEVVEYLDAMGFLGKGEPSSMPARWARAGA